MTAQDLLDRAQQLIDSGNPGRNRAACWLARAALEDVVRQRLHAAGYSPGTSTMRSQLTCLEVACQDDDTAATAEHAWARLSGACHHHAFELAPTATEAQRLIDAVQALVDPATRPTRLRLRV